YPEGSMSFVAALRAAFPTLEIKDSPEDLEHWGRDWTRFDEARPMGIAFVRSASELSEVLKFSLKHSQPVVPSGGRTGLAGGAVASRGELVVSLDRMAALESVDVAAGTVRVQAGVVTRRIQDAAREAGLYWPIDLASAGS